VRGRGACDDEACIFTSYRAQIMRALWGVWLDPTRVWEDLRRISYLEGDAFVVMLLGPVREWVKRPDNMYYLHDRSCNLGWPRSVGFGEKTMYEVLPEE